jgi:hypothetical protein
MNDLKRFQVLAAGFLAAWMFLGSASTGSAAVRYVDLNSTNATPPYTNWATAAAIIQDAVDAAVAGDQIVVTNGIYATGGRAVGTNLLANRVAVDKPVTLRSVNGPQFTVIQGEQVRGATNGDGAVRCVYLADGASFSGFTLTNGATRAVYDFPANRESSGGGLWCESTHAAVTNCVLAGNSAFGGGAGAYQGTLNNCTISGNQSSEGGGAFDSILNDCVLIGNVAYYSGGGISGGAANKCILRGNSARDSGGGANYTTLTNCTLTGNSAGTGGGADQCTLKNCALTANSASSGGGAYFSTLNNCTLTGNSSSEEGGGAVGSTLNNCIVYFNMATHAANYEDSSLNYCCTIPLPTNGVGNISLDPQLASAIYLSANSPCRGAGSAAYASGTDIDGEPWANPPSLGCDEFHAGALTGALSVSITASFTTVASNYPVRLTAWIEGRTTASTWDFDDGSTATNQPDISHTWAAPADYSVVLRAFNDSQPNGLSATVTVHVVTQPVHYVAADSTTPVAPYTSWATAAPNIQDAVDAATVPGALVVVSNGVYAPLRVSKPLTLRSVNGAQVTTIDGAAVSQCAYLITEASLSGFTVTHGVGFFGAGAHGGTLNDCILVGNSGFRIRNPGNPGVESFGGGAYSCTLNNCVLTGNWASEGGGAYECVLNHCVLTGNEAFGALDLSTGPGFGGGAYLSTLSNCTLTDNSALGGGGGADSSTLINCALTANSANSGGGASGSTLTNCTLTGNSAGNGGGAFGSSLNNCIVYFNSAPRAPNYDSSSTLNYCCTTPQPTNGLGTISSDPQLASASHLSAASPCRGAGNPAYASGTDIDDEAWATPPSIGCDEYHAGAATGPLSVALTMSYTSVLPNFIVQLMALIEGRVSESEWDFGDGTSVTNQPFTSHAWTGLGDYSVVLRAYNDSHPGGITSTVTVHVVDGFHYAAANSTNPVAPYAAWATAASNIQDAVDAAIEPGAVVVVGDGVFATGGPPGRRVVLVNPITLRSLNGPYLTIIDGGHSVGCAFLNPGSTMSGFTLRNGLAPSGFSGGGIYASDATIFNCIIISNSAPIGGGAAGGTLNNCTLIGNQSTSYFIFASDAYGGGGGAVGATLNNCTLVGNSTLWGPGGGALNSSLNNCIVYFNTAAEAGANYDAYSTLNYCCTTPQPASGTGNITNTPLFVNEAAGNLRLQSNSPCVDSGDNSFISAATDLDGRPRIVGGRVDMGAYEYQASASGAFIGWLEQFGLPTDGTADFTDPDHDGMNNWQEWICGTDPTNALSALRLLSPLAGATNVTVTWQSVVGKNYFLERATNLSASPAFTSLATNIPGQFGTTTFIDSNPAPAGPFYYRVGVNGP